MNKISCIIPAYNEAPRIEKVLRAVFRHPLVDEIIVIDDCSKDNTSEIVEKFIGVKLIVNEKNQGKSQSIVTGVRASANDLLLFLDADLVGITAQDVTNLIEPVLSGQADISISLRQNAPWQYRKIGLDFISGERVFPKKLIEGHLETIAGLRCFCLESYMNKLIIKNKYRIKVVSWPNVQSPWPNEKRGFWRGTKDTISMTFDVLKTNWFFGVFYEIMKMSVLKVK